MKKGRLLRIGAAVSILALSLTGCGLLMPTPKDNFVGAYKNLFDAKTIETTTEYSFSLKSDVPEESLKQGLDFFNAVSFNLHTISDLGKGKSETDLSILSSANGMEISEDLNGFIDKKSKKLYTKAETVLSAYSLIGGLSIDLPSDLKDAIIVLDDVGQSEGSNKEFGLELINYSEDKFKVNGDVITVKMAGEEFKKDLLKKLEDSKAFLGVEVQAYILNMVKELDNLTFGEATIKLEIKDGTIKTQDVIIPLTFESFAGIEINAEVKVKTTVENINQPVEFSYDLKKGTILTLDELKEKFKEVQKQQQKNK
ncbi:hypothetical protein [Viridibacillus arvi]|uniref:hypothetical protein n=1 Tax=Viridibacillus arvi TaxID=263475 RepID=UPI0034CDFF37